MKRQTFTILFYIKRTKLLKNGEAPIRMRITIDGQKAETQLKRSVLVEEWNQDKECTTGKSSKCREINHYLDSVRVEIFQLHRQAEVDGKVITAQSIKQVFCGEDVSQKTILELFEEHNKKMNQLVGKDFSQKTADRYDTSIRHLQEFIKLQYRRDDMIVGEIDHAFITDFDYFLKMNKSCNHNSALKHLKSLKKIVRIAVVNEWIKKDPFRNIKIKEENVTKEFLTQEELNNLINKDFEIKRIEQVRDLFLFCCMTGLSFIDLKQLRPEHLLKDNQGKMWIRKARQKTGIMCNIPILELAQKLILKYEGCSEEGTIFPVMTNQRLNSYLKEIADLCSIKKNLTMHVARHTFGSVVTLANGVTLENVAKMLGHTNLNMTRHYAKVLDQTIMRDMENVEKALSQNAH